MIRLPILSALTAALVSFGATQASACTTPANVNALATEVASGLNAHRAANGLPQVAFNRRLGQAAMNHACDMSANGFFGHNGSNGSDIVQRVNSTGYRQCLVAENLAWGYPRSEQIVSGWMNSAGHRANMLHPRVAEFGVAITEGPKGPNWVLVLARGC